MIDEPPPVPAPEQAPAAPGSVALPSEQRADGTLVIDLLPLAPPLPPQDCAEREPDPFRSEIIVCSQTAPPPRLAPGIGPADADFASAIPRARLKLSDKAAAEANATAPAVGGWNAQGGEVRLKIDF